MLTHRDIIAFWPTVAALAAAVGVPYRRAKGWAARHRIPSAYWPAVIVAAREQGQALSLADLALSQNALQSYQK